MMKNIFTILILAIITLLGYIAVCAEPLAGDISSTEGGTSFGGKVWYASYMKMKPSATPRKSSTQKKLDDPDCMVFWDGPFFSTLPLRQPWDRKVQVQCHSLQ